MVIHDKLWQSYNLTIYYIWQFMAGYDNLVTSQYIIHGNSWQVLSVNLLTVMIGELYFHCRLIFFHVFCILYFYCDFTCFFLFLFFYKFFLTLFMNQLTFVTGNNKIIMLCFHMVNF